MQFVIVFGAPLCDTMRSHQDDYIGGCMDAGRVCVRKFELEHSFECKMAAGMVWLPLLNRQQKLWNFRLILIKFKFRHLKRLKLIVRS